ncbi:hypothetical protein [Sinomonas sp.]
MAAAGQFDPTALITEHEPMSSAIEEIEASEASDRREPGSVKVELADVGS